MNPMNAHLLSAMLAFSFAGAVGVSQENERRPVDQSTDTASDVISTSPIRRTSTGDTHCELVSTTGMPPYELRVVRRVDNASGSVQQRVSVLPRLVPFGALSAPPDAFEVSEGRFDLAASLDVGASTQLRVWRLDTGSKGAAEAVVLSASVFETVEVRASAETPGGRFRQLDQPRFLRSGNVTSLIVSALADGVTETVSERVVLQLEMSSDLDHIVAARVLARGVDARVGGSPERWWITVRQPSNLREDLTGAPLAILRSSNARTWNAEPAGEGDLRVQPDYSVGHSAGTLWVASPSVDDRLAINVWRLEPQSRVWESRGDLTLRRAHPSLRGESVWFAEEDAPAGGRPLVTYQGAVGLEARRL
jgi:hypothetical protein